MVKLETLGPEIFSVPLLSSTECTDILTYAQTPKLFDFADPPISFASGASGPQVLQKNQLPQSQVNPIWESLESTIRNSLIPTLQEQGLDIDELRDPQLICYTAGTTSTPHRDTTSDHNNFRRYTLLLYINDGYLGGQTFFLDNNQAVDPVQGAALIFASDKEHCGTKVHRGSKYLYCVFLGKHNSLES